MSDFTMKSLARKTFKNPTLALILWLLLSASSCNQGSVEVEVGKNTLATLDKGINTLQSESANWQKVVQETRDSLEGEASSLVKNELTDLVSNGIAATGIEVRCTADFMRKRARLELIHVRNAYAQKVGASLLEESPLGPTFCGATPGSINLNLPPEKRTELRLAGYDFDENTVRVFLLEGDQEIEVTSNNLSNLSQYMVSLNISEGNGVEFSRKSNKIIIRTSREGKFLSSLNVIQPAPIGQNRSAARFAPGFYSHVEMNPPGIIYLWPSPWDGGKTDSWCDLPDHEMFLRHINSIGSATGVDNLDLVKRRAKYWSQKCTDDVFDHPRIQN
jgi:hypothetical protein